MIDVKGKIMSEEDKKRIEQEAFDLANKSWELPGDDERLFLKGYIAGAEAEFNRREKEVAQLIDHKAKAIALLEEINGHPVEADEYELITNLLKELK